jgi:alpha-glucoside transport system permease protein
VQDGGLFVIEGNLFEGAGLPPARVIASWGVDARPSTAFAPGETADLATARHVTVNADGAYR